MQAQLGIWLVETFDRNLDIVGTNYSYTNFRNYWLKIVPYVIYNSVITVNLL